MWVDITRVPKNFLNFVVRMTFYCRNFMDRLVQRIKYIYSVGRFE